MATTYKPPTTKQIRAMVRKNRAKSRAIAELEGLFQKAKPLLRKLDIKLEVHAPPGKDPDGLHIIVREPAKIIRVRR